MLSDILRRARVRRDAFAFAHALLVVGCVSTSRQSNPSSTRAAPDFGAQTVTGRAIRLGDLRGTVVVLHVWAAWDCAEELPGLDDIASRLAPHGAVVVAVAIDRTATEVVRIAAQRDRWNLTFLHDPTTRVAGLYDPSDFPAAYVIDREGYIRHAYQGLTNADLPRIERDARRLVFGTK